MKLLGYLLMAISLTAGLIATTTAYMPVLDDSLEGEVLNLPAGMDAEGNPIATKETVLTPEVIAELRAAEVKRVKIKAFSLERWSFAWLFAISVIVLIGGGLIVRFVSKKEIAAAGSLAESHPAGSPTDILDTIEEQIAALRRDLDDIFDQEAKLTTIVDRVSDILGEHVAAFFELRSSLIGTYGLGGFAGIMDRFSALERMLNRTWSAAADGHLGESTRCLAEASTIVPDVRDRMSQR